MGKMGSSPASNALIRTNSSMFLPEGIPSTKCSSAMFTPASRGINLITEWAFISASTASRARLARFMERVP